MPAPDPRAFLAAFEKGPLLLDAAVGTELTRRGADTSPPLWSARAIVESPEILAAIHEDDAAAGADILTAATFRTHERSLARAGWGARADDVTKRAVAIAREAGRSREEPWGGAGRAELPPCRIACAGSLAPLEECYRPDLVPDDAALAREHRVQAERLADAGVDLILVETMNTLREAVAATRAALATGLPVVTSFVTDGEGRLLSGESLEDAARALLLLSPSPLAVGVNCVPARKIAGEIARLSRAVPGVPLSAYGNTGRPLDAKGLSYTDPISPADYALLAREVLGLGVRLVGGCCGTTAAHTRALRKMLG